jgi:hypothetical protein
VSQDPAPDPIVSYLEWYFERHPVHADALGAAGYAHRIGDFSTAAFTSHERDAAQWLVRFEAEPESIDRDLIVSSLQGTTLMAGWPSWRRDPSVYLSPVFAGLLLPFLHQLRPESELVDGVLSRLAQVPEVLAACRDNLDVDLAAPRLVHRALRQAAAGPSFLRDSLPAEVQNPELRLQLVDAAVPAVQAFEETTSFLTDLAERATGDWRMGEKLYSALLTQRELLGYGAEELHRHGIRAWDALDAQAGAGRPGARRQCRLAVHHGSPPGRSPADGRGDARGVRGRDRPGPGFPRRPRAGHLRRGRAMPGGTRAGLPAPDHGGRLIPASTGTDPIAHRSLLRALHPRRRHRGADRPALRTNARAQLPTIAAHETYPGHHWQLCWAAQASPPLRAVHRSSYFAEGWALYAEGMMREQGYFTDPAHELAHLDARIFRAARMIVDTALHCGDMNEAQAEEFMATRASLSPGTAKAEVDRYCAWPTQAPSYLTGCLEIERLRIQWSGQLRDFHDTLAGSGCLPLGLARRALASNS